MPTVDAFFEFIVQELKEEGVFGVGLHTSGDQWVVERNRQDDEPRGSSVAPSLSSVLNKVSREFGFTGKDLAVEEEPSVVKRVAELAGARDMQLIVFYFKGGYPVWEVHAGGKAALRVITVQGVALEQCLQDMIEKLLGENE